MIALPPGNKTAALRLANLDEILTGKFQGGLYRREPIRPPLHTVRRPGTLWVAAGYSAGGRRLSRFFSTLPFRFLPSCQGGLSARRKTCTVMDNVRGFLGRQGRGWSFRREAHGASKLV